MLKQKFSLLVVNGLMLNIAIILVSSYSIFTVYGWYALYFEWSFNDVLNNLMLPFIISLFISGYLFISPLNWSIFRGSNLDLEQNTEKNILGITTKFIVYLGYVLLVVSLITTVANIDSSFKFSWLCLITGLTLIYTGYHQNYALSFTEEKQGSGRLIWLENLFLLLMGLVLIFLYLSSSITNSDDSHFVSYIVGLLKYPDIPIFSYETIFNEKKENFIFFLNYGQSWELLTAILSVLFNTDHFNIYYIFIPCLFLLVTAAPIYYFTKLYFPKYAAVSIFFSVSILLIWSNYNHMHGMFFIPRFFQGKAILLSFILPLLVLLSRSYFIKKDFKSTCLLLAVLISAAGVSTTGVYVSLLVFGMCFLAYTPLKINKWMLTALCVLLLMLPNLLMLAQIKSKISEQRQPAEEYSLSSIQSESLQGQSTREIQRPISSFYWLFGDHIYLFLVLLFYCITFLLLFKKSSQHEELRRFYLILGLIAFNHPLAEFIATHIGPSNLVWRFHWSLPLPILFSLFAARLLEFGQQLANGDGLLKAGRGQWATLLSTTIPIGLVVSTLILFLMSHAHLSSRFSSSPLWFKVQPDSLRVARELVASESGDDVILSANSVSEILPMLVRNSMLISSRPLLWQFPYFHSDETLKRIRLQFLINEMDQWTYSDQVFFDKEIKQRRITQLVFENKLNSVSSEYIERKMFNQCAAMEKKWRICYLTH